MCGIMGYTGTQAVEPIIIKGLEGLEYRGYDSAGIGVINEGKVHVYKTEGSPEKLWKEVPEKLHSFVGIGHTRWATHGAPSDINSHPHMSEDRVIAVVHNGIIENYLSIKEELSAKGYRFVSETDTETECFIGDHSTFLNNAIIEIGT